MNINPPSFIIIPYQLLADERIKPVEEKLYGFIYWFTKLRNEKCTAGNDALAKLVQTTPGVIQNSLTNLEKRGYIRRVFKDRNKRVREEIIPLIDFANVEAKAPELETGEKPPRKPRAKKATIVTAEGGEQDTTGSIVNGMIELFEPLNPSYERLFAIKPQRAAIERMITKHGVEKVMGAIKYAIEVNGQAYAPTVTTPMELESKLGHLSAHYKKEHGKGPKMVTL